MQILCFPGAAYDFPLPTNRQQMMRRLAERGHDVLYVEPPRFPLSSLVRPALTRDSLALWLRRTGQRLLAASLGLILGGALGNAVDRVAYGAVFDFVHVHVGSFSWYVFNVADAAIVAGVVGLLYDSLFLEGRRTRAASS